MSKHLLALAVAAALSTTLAGCSSSDDSNDTDGTANGGTANGGTADGGTADGNGGGASPGTSVGEPTAPTGGGAASGDTKAGIYTGDFFGTGFEQGVFVVDNEFNLVGLALAENGSAKSVFGELGDADTFQGPVREYTHDASRSTASADGSFGVSGAEPEPGAPIALTFTNGTSIDGSAERGVALSVPIDGSLNPATLQTVAGTWTAENQFGDCATTAADATCSLETTLTFEGTTVSGTTNTANPVSGLSSYVNPIDGVVTEFGDALLINLNWGTEANGNLNAYRGAVFFDVTSGDRLVYVAESAGAGANPKVLTAVMTRSQ